MYVEGLGVLQDFKQAVKWYTLAAEQGDASAQVNLGNMYAEGQGVPQDDNRAHMWWNIAGASGHGTARNSRDRVANRMTFAQLETAQQLARECVQKNYKDC